MDVPGAALKLVSRSRRVASNIASEQISSHHPQTRGKTPTSTTESKET